jgi:hypothetical protein
VGRGWTFSHGPRDFAYFKRYMRFSFSKERRSVSFLGK